MLSIVAKYPKKTYHGTFNRHTWKRNSLMGVTSRFRKNSCQYFNCFSSVPQNKKVWHSKLVNCMIVWSAINQNSNKLSTRRSKISLILWLFLEQQKYIFKFLHNTQQKQKFKIFDVSHSHQHSSGRRKLKFLVYGVRKALYFVVIINNSTQDRKIISEENGADYTEAYLRSE